MLLVGVVGTADQRPGRHVFESHGLSRHPQCFETPPACRTGRWPDAWGTGAGTVRWSAGSQSTFRRSAMVSSISSVVSPIPAMMPDLVTVCWVDVLGFGQQFQRKFVIALGPYLGEDADRGLDVVVQDSRSGIDDPLQGGP